MGVVVDVIRAAVNTSTGNQTFTGDIGGLTPKAARFIMVKATTDGTAAADRYMSVGFTDGTRERVVGFSENDGTATTEVQSWYRTDKCIEFVNEAGSEIASATFVSFGADAVTVNWTTAPGSAWLLTVELYGGSDLTAYVDHVDVLNTVDNTEDVTAPGFEPDVLLTIGNMQVNDPSSTAQGLPSFGLVHNDGASTITQRALTYFVRDGRIAEDTKAYIRNDAGIVQISTTALDWYGEFHTFDSSGFSVSARNAGGNNREVCYLALNFGGVVDSKVITYNTPTSTGDDANTAIGFTPQFITTLNHQIGSVNTFTEDATVGTFGISSIVSDTEFSNSAQSEDNAGTINAQSLSDNVAFELPDDDGTANLTGTLSSFDASGFTINYTAVGASAYPFFLLAIEEQAGGSPYTLTAAQGSYTLTGQATTLTADRTITAAQGAYALTGQAVGIYAARLLTAVQGSYTLTGQDAILTAARLLTAGQGSYGLTGQTSVLTVARLLTAVQGSYSLTGQDTALLATRLLTAAQGSYTLTGQDVTLTYTPLGAYTLTADQGSYTLSGQAAGLFTARLLTAAQGSYALTGQDATLTYTPLGSYLLTAAQGSYSLTGQTAGLIAYRTIAAGQGSYALTGQDAGLLAGRSLTAVQGSYTLTGIDTALIVARTLVAIYGSYTLTGQTAVLSYSGDVSEGIILSGDVLIRLIAEAAANMRFTTSGDVAARFTAEGDTEL